jgi:RNA polymerase sigma-70 factor (ECF subfamily)
MVYDPHQIEHAVREYQAGRNTESNFTLIFNNLQPALIAFFRQQGCQPQDQIDLTQTVIIRVFERVGSFEGRSSFKTWAMVIARNILIDTGRKLTTVKRKAPPTVFLDNIGEDNDGKLRLEVVDPEPDPHTLTENLELRRVIRRAFETLPPQMRKCVTFYYLDGLTRSEIAGLLGLTEGGVNAHLNQANKKLRKYMEKFYGMKSSGSRQAK